MSFIPLVGMTASDFAAHKGKVLIACTFNTIMIQSFNNGLVDTYFV